MSVSLKDVAFELANIISRALKKSSKGASSEYVLGILKKLYKKYNYLVISRIPDLRYSTTLINIFAKCTEGKYHDLKATIAWGLSKGIKFNMKDPLDLLRLILDANVEICLKGHYDEHNLLNIDLRMAKYSGWCDLLRGISEYAATQFTYMYLYHMEQFTIELYNKYMKKNVSSIHDIVSASEEETEKFRVYVTAKIFPTSKALLLEMLMLKFRWPLFLMEKKDIDALGGIRNVKLVEPTYLGRITSELLDSIMGIHYDETILRAYDTIVFSYFNIFREFSRTIEMLYEVDYIESHPAITSMIIQFNKMMDELTPQARQYLRRRGIMRLGEIKQDVKDYILTLYYLNKKAFEYGFPQVSEVTKYDIYELVTKNRLKKEV